ncbi:MAG: hypothetical protein ABI333_28025 [bacterium]
MRFCAHRRRTAGLAVLLGLGVCCRDPAPPASGGDPAREVRAQASLKEAPRRPVLRCEQGLDPFVVVLERQVAPGARFRLLAVSERALGSVKVRGGARGIRELHRRRGAGPPFARQYEGVAPEAVGRHPVRLLSVSGRQLACVELRVVPGHALTPRPAPTRGVWRIRRSWNDAWERVFSAWIAHLFRPLPKQPEGWRPLHRVLHQARRNFLHNRLGHGEDARKNAIRVHAWADCGDTPYQLRAYFAWKLGLPFRFRRCDRGNSVRGPRCPFARDNRTDKFDRLGHPVRRFNAFLREGVAWNVHSGTMRTLPEDEDADFYPIALTRHSIRPGTVYVDVGGHAFVVTQWDEGGLYAIDGHPDLSVSRRRFSPKFFRYSRGTRTGGFKAFRPLRLLGDRIVPLPNRALKRFFSVEQYRFASGRAFYREMNQLIAVSL